MVTLLDVKYSFTLRPFPVTVRSTIADQLTEIDLQWNLSNLDTGTKIIVLIGQACLFQGENSMHLRTSSVLINQVSLFQGGGALRDVPLYYIVLPFLVLQPSMVDIMLCF